MTEGWRRALVTGLTLAALAGSAHGARGQDAPPPEAFTVLDDPAEAGPRITPYLREQLDRAWAQDEARRATFAKVHTVFCRGARTIGTYT